MTPMIIRELISAALLLVGGGFMFVSAVGVLRLPDFYTRLHASSIGETFGLVLVGIGLIVYNGINLPSAKILLIIIALFLVNPVGTHLIGKAAIREGESTEAYTRSGRESGDDARTESEAGGDTTQSDGDNTTTDIENDI